VLDGIAGYEGLAFESDGSWNCTSGFPFAANTLPANLVSVESDLHGARK
jgi:hypothetical protein